MKKTDGKNRSETKPRSRTAKKKYSRADYLRGSVLATIEDGKVVDSKDLHEYLSAEAIPLPDPVQEYLIQLVVGKRGRGRPRAISMGQRRFRNFVVRLARHYIEEEREGIRNALDRNPD